MSKKMSHKGHYFSLVLILGLGLLALIFASPNKKLQTEIFIMISFFYIVWGVFHHGINHRLNSKIVVEYILIAALGIAALMFFLTGAFGI